MKMLLDVKSWDNLNWCQDDETQTRIKIDKEKAVQNSCLPQIVVESVEVSTDGRSSLVKIYDYGYSPRYWFNNDILHPYKKLEDIFPSSYDEIIGFIDDGYYDTELNPEKATHREYIKELNRLYTLFNKHLADVSHLRKDQLIYLISLRIRQKENPNMSLADSRKDQVNFIREILTRLEKI